LARVDVGLEERLGTGDASNAVRRGLVAASARLVLRELWIYAQPLRNEAGEDHYNFLIKARSPVMRLAGPMTRSAKKKARRAAGLL